MFRLPKLQVNSLGPRPSSRRVMTSHLLSLRGSLRKQDTLENNQHVSAFGPFLHPLSSTSFLYCDNVDAEKMKSVSVVNVNTRSDDAFGIKCGNQFHPLLLTPHNKLSLIADILHDEYSATSLTLTTDLKQVRRKIAVQDDYQDMFAQFKTVHVDETKSNLKQDTTETIDIRMKPLDMEKILARNKSIKKLNSIDEEDVWTKYVEKTLESNRRNSKDDTDLVHKSLKLLTELEKQIEEQKLKKMKPKSLKAKDFKPFELSLNKNKSIERLLMSSKRDSGTQHDQTIYKPSKQSLKKVLKIPKSRVLFNKTKTNLKDISRDISVLPPSAVPVPLSNLQKKIVIPNLPEMPKKVLTTRSKSPAVPFSSTGTAKQIQRKATQKQVQIFEMKLPRIVHNQEAIDKNRIFSLKSILRAQQSNFNLKR